MTPRRLINLGVGAVSTLLFPIASSSAQSLPVRSATVTTNGVQLYYEIFGSGSPVLLVHGLAVTGAWWGQPIIGALAADHTVIVPDIRGHGRSTNPTGRFSDSLVATDLRGLLDSLKLDRVAAVGHANGASALTFLASRNPERISRLVTIAMGIRMTQAQRDEFKSYTSMDKIPPGLKVLFLRNQPGGLAQAEDILGYSRQIGADTNDFNFTAAMVSRIAVPVLIIGGDRDNHTVENKAALYRAIPKSRLWIIPGQGHFPFWPALGGDTVLSRTFPATLRGFLDGPPR